MRTEVHYIKVVLILGIGLLSTTQLFAQCKEEQQALDNLQKEYNVLFVDLEKQTEDLKKALPDTTDMPSVPGHHVSFDIKFKTQKISFDLIEVTMKNKKMSLNLPQVTMKTKSFSIPTSKTEWRVTNIGFGIKTKTLVVTNGTKRVSFKLPETKMKRTEMVTKIPEFTKKRKEISFDIPEFKMKSPIPEDEKINELQKKSEVIAQQADTLNKAGTKLEKEQKEKAKIAITNLFSCIENELKIQKIQTEKSFEQSLNQINAAIQEVKSHDLNPAQVKSDDGTVTNLHQVKEDFQKSNDEIIKNIDIAVKDLNEQLQKIISELDS